MLRAVFILVFILGFISAFYVLQVWVFVFGTSLVALAARAVKRLMSR